LENCISGTLLTEEILKQFCGQITLVQEGKFIVGDRPNYVSLSNSNRGGVPPLGRLS